MPTVKLSLNIDHYQAFDMLCQSLHVNLKEDPPEFVVEDGEIVVKDFDDRGELYMALYHLATKIFSNTYFRSIFDDPNTLMAELYKEKEKQNA